MQVSCSIDHFGKGKQGSEELRVSDFFKTNVTTNKTLITNCSRPTNNARLAIPHIAIF